MGSVHQIRWDGNLKHNDHLILQVQPRRWSELVQNRAGYPGVHVRLLVASRQLPYHSGQGEDLVAGKSVGHRPERRELHCAEAVDHVRPEMKTKSKISGYIIRSGAWAVFLSVAFIAASSAFDSPNRWYESAGTTGAYDTTAKTSSQPRTFSFAERVAFQRVIEDVYWRHRIWPKENPDPKPSLDAVMSQAQLENKVAGYLRASLMLEDHWQRPITAEQLQAEMDRMARNTKQPGVLLELFEALGNDPAVIAECLARPILAERLIADLSQDQTRQVESQQTDALRTMSMATTLGQVVYTLPEIGHAGDPQCTDQWGATSTTNAPEARLFHTAVWTGSEMIVWGGTPDNSFTDLNTGGRYNPSTDSWIATSTHQRAHYPRKPHRSLDGQ